MTERQRLEAFLREEIESYFRTTRLVNDEDHALKAVCQVILWACSLDEHHVKNTTGYEALRDSDSAGEHLNGVRYARNRAIHQFAELVEITHGAILPAPLPFPFFEIRWKQVAALPPPDPTHPNRRLEAAYANLLAGVPVRFTFDALADFLRRVP